MKRKNLSMKFLVSIDNIILLFSYHIGLFSDVLSCVGSNTLFDLKDCIYCVQDAVNGAPQARH